MAMETSSAETETSIVTSNEAETPIGVLPENPQQENKALKIVICVLFLTAIAGLSAAVYFNQDKLQYIGNYGLFGVFILCFICNATVLLPAPGLLVIVTAATFINPILVALVGAAGTTLGETTGYFSGRAGKRLIDANKNKSSAALKKYGSPVIFIFALLPWPIFDIIGITSGYLGIKWQKFLIACYLGKFIKMACYAYGFNYLNDILANMTI